MRCKHCFYWEDLNAKTNDLSVDELDKTTRNMGDLLHLIITGGEPYVRHDLDEVVNVFVKNTKVGIISIPSNGYFTDRMVNKLEIMLAGHPDVSILQNISLDNVGLKHDEFRVTKNSYEKATQTMLALRELNQRFKNLSTGVIITFNQENQDNFKEILQTIFDTQRPNNITVNLVRGNPKERVNLDLDIGKYREAIAYRDELYQSGELQSHDNFTLSKMATAARMEVNRQVEKTFAENQFQSLCYAGNLHGVLYANGDVFPCELLSDNLGNVRDFDYDFRQLWHSEKTQKLVRSIQKGKCFCTHECFITTNVVFNPKFLPRLLKIASQV